MFSKKSLSFSHSGEPPCPIKYFLFSLLVVPVLPTVFLDHSLKEDCDIIQSH